MAAGIVFAAALAGAAALAAAPSVLARPWPRAAAWIGGVALGAAAFAGAKGAAGAAAVLQHAPVLGPPAVVFAAGSAAWLAARAASGPPARPAEPAGWGPWIIVAAGAALAAGAGVALPGGLGIGPGVAAPLAAALLAAAGEELAFRGGLLGVLARLFPGSLTRLWAIAASAGVYAVWEGTALIGPDLVFLKLPAASAALAGLALGWITVRSGSLLPALALHMIGAAAFTVL